MKEPDFLEELRSQVPGNPQRPASFSARVPAKSGRGTCGPLLAEDSPSWPLGGRKPGVQSWLWPFYPVASCKAQAHSSLGTSREESSRPHCSHAGV